MGVGLLGTGHYVPNNVVTNKDLEKIVDTSDEWIRTRTGIEERRIADKEMDTSDMAFYAAQNAMEEANISAEDLDMILVATVTPDIPFPSIACMLQERLGAPAGIAAMDVSAACAGFMYGVITANNLSKQTPIKIFWSLVSKNCLKLPTGPIGIRVFCSVMVLGRLSSVRFQKGKGFCRLNSVPMARVEKSSIKIRKRIIFL